MVQALEHQYQRGLLCINEELPQTEVTLVFKQGRLQFEPSLEELKTAHYKQLLKPFLSIPLNFKVEGDAVLSGMAQHSRQLLMLSLPITSGGCADLSAARLLVQHSFCTFLVRV